MWIKHSAAAAAIATSLAEAVRKRSTLRVLDLTAAADLVCQNMMCEKLGDPCICRVSVALQKLQGLQHLCLAKNRLLSAPEVISQSTLPELVSLDLSFNRLEELPLPVVQHKGLRDLYLQGNPLAAPVLKELELAVHMAVHVDVLQAHEYEHDAPPLASKRWRLPAHFVVHDL